MSGDSVKVAVRCRPFNQREKNANSSCIISMNGKVTSIVHPESGESRTFAFDHSYWSHDGFAENNDGINEANDPSKDYADQRRVFNDLGQGVLDNAWQGYNAALFAYGQTGSGKSYSMIGYGANKGIVPITCDELFKAISQNEDKTKQFQVTFSMLEIYNEQVRDLLSSAKAEKGGLRVRQNPKSGFYVEGLKCMPVQSYSQIDKMMEQGTLNRTTASTNMNATSSRSHMVITITFKQIYKNDMGQSTTKSSEINLVDLAGSERAASTGATGDRLKEGSAINQSLSSLGKVISALADHAMGKKKVMVPYRDSVLTKLLQSALGGNSRTIMIAALSPAAMNHDETLSTLRYADRAKRIQNKATVNESPTDKLIRELKEENAKLMQKLKAMNIGGNSPNHDDLTEMLAHNEAEMNNLGGSWQDKLEEARREWEKEQQKDVGKVPEWKRVPYLQNVNEDPQLSGVIKHPLTDGKNILGKSGTKGVTIGIRGLGIQSQHASLQVTKGMVSIEPSTKNSGMLVNGKAVKSKTQLQHLDRIKLGSNSLYLFIGPPSDRSTKDNADEFDYNYFQTELAESSGFNQDLLKFKESEDQEIDTVSMLVFQDYINLLPKIYEANSMSEEMKKSVVFDAEIKNLTTHDSFGRSKLKEIIVKVIDKKSRKVWVWSREKFINRKFMIEDLYQKHLDSENINVDQSKDPFWDPLEDTFLGSCHVWLNNIAYCLDSDDFLDVRNYHGREEGQVRVKLIPCDAKGKKFKDELIVFDPRELLAKRLDFIVEIPQGTGLKWVMGDNIRGAYCGFNFYDHPKIVKTDVVHHSVNPKFHFKKHFTIQKVTEDFLEYLQSNALVIELWGTQGGDSSVSNGLNGSLVEMVDQEDEDQAALVKELQAKLQRQEQELVSLKRDKERHRRDSFKAHNGDAAGLSGGLVRRRSGSISTTLPPLDEKERSQSPKEIKQLQRLMSSPDGDYEPYRQMRRESMPATIPGRRMSITNINFSSINVSSPISPPPERRRSILSRRVSFNLSNSPPQSEHRSPRLINPLSTKSISPVSPKLEKKPMKADHKIAQTAAAPPPPTPQQSLDADIAKALKVFFRDVKSVQKKIQDVKQQGSDVTNSPTNGHNLQNVVQKQVSSIGEVEGELGACVGSLRETMLKIIRKKKAEEH